ncbi:MAG: heparan-alpha-glucosaminide N-acetyltransferase domain-containing protein [Smithella sp.]
MEQSERYQALDVLRGMTIALMILVNTPGSWHYVYAPLRHAEWHGCTAADLVFPFFLFVVGVSLFFSLAKNQIKLDKESLLHVGRRALLIFIIGVFINSYPPWMTDYSHLRIMGVLQRIAVAYGIAALIVISAPRRWLPGIGGFILLIYWGILYFFGGPDPYSLHANAAIPFDKAILGESHLYKGFGIPFDPEGILSSLPSVGTVLIGYLAGMMIQETARNRVPVKLSFFGIALTIVGYIWGLTFPINKPLWTSSYVLYTAGLASLLFALLIYMIDINGYKKWSLLFSVFGMNPLFLFILSVLWGKTLRLLIRLPDGDGNTVTGSAWLYQNIFVPPAGNMNGSLAYALAHIAFLWLIGYILYKRRIFVKV